MGMPVFSESYFESLRRVIADLDEKERRRQTLDEVETEAVLKRIKNAAQAAAERKKADDEGTRYRIA